MSNKIENNRLNRYFRIILIYKSHLSISRKTETKDENKLDFCIALPLASKTKVLRIRTFCYKVDYISDLRRFL